MGRIISIGEKLNKLLALLLVASLSSLSVNAKEIEKDKWEDKRQICDMGTKVARAVMNARQQGVPIEEMYENLSGIDTRVRGLFEGIIKTAYEAPIIQSEQLAERATLEFTNQFFKACMS